MLMSWILQIYTTLGGKKRKEYVTAYSTFLMSVMAILWLPQDARTKN